LLEVLVLLKQLPDLRRNGMQGVDDLVTALGEGNTVLGQPKSHQQQGNVLGRVSSARIPVDTT
jgi:hypothetical protein